MAKLNVDANQVEDWNHLSLQAPPEAAATPGAHVFWAGVILIGVGAGVSAAVLAEILFAVQSLAWPAPDGSIVEAALAAGFWRHVAILLGAGLLTGVAQYLLVRLSAGNGIEITTALWFKAGRLPPLRTFGSALLSVLTVAMGESLGREGAPKQISALLANFISDRFRFSDEQRRLLVACGAGAGMAAIYDVPLGGALFALEVVRGVLSLRLVLPALATSVIATVIAWSVVPNAPTYRLSIGGGEVSILIWSLFAAPVAGVASVAFVRMIAKADRIRPESWRRFLAPPTAFALLGLASVAFPQLLGNGRELAQLTFDGAVPPLSLVLLLGLKPLAIFVCLASGGVGGLFTPSLTFGALLGSVLGLFWTWLWPGAPLGAFAVIGAGAVLAATTQGPISAVVLMIELTGRDRAFIAPMLVAVTIATLTARTIDPRSIYDARLTDDELAERQRLREPARH